METDPREFANWYEVCKARGDHFPPYRVDVDQMGPKRREDVMTIEPDWMMCNCGTGLDWCCVHGKAGGGQYGA